MESTVDTDLRIPTRRRIIYCELDGVLCDFESKVTDICGVNSRAFTPEELWPMLQVVDMANQRVFTHSCPGSLMDELLWDKLAPLQPVILTTLPRGKWADPQKRLWCSRELGPHVRVVTSLSLPKRTYCNPGDILIDDMDYMCLQWQSRGGIFIHHKSAVHTLVQLDNLEYCHLASNILLLYFLNRNFLRYRRPPSSLRSYWRRNPQFPLQWGSMLTCTSSSDVSRPRRDSRGLIYPDSNPSKEDFL